MMKKTDQKWMPIIVGIAVLLIGAVIYAVVLSQRMNSSATEPTAKPTISTVGNQSKPQESETSNVSVTLNSYTVYALNEVPFRFVIADLHVTSDQSINLTLDHFKTSEGIALDQIQDYVNQLESESLYLGKQNVWYSILSVEPSTDTRIFIPVQSNDLTSLEVTADFLPQSPISFDLTNPTGTTSDLLYEATDVITDGQSYEMTVSEAFDITGSNLVQTEGGNSEAYLLPSTTRVYAFHVQAVSLWEDSIAIESAQYIPDETGETFQALDSTIQAEKYQNMLGRSIQDQEDGYLFFYAYDPDSHPITYHGVLKLILKDHANPILIHVNLN